MIEIEITKIERKSDWKNRTEEWGELGAKIHFTSTNLSRDFVPEELTKYFSNILYYHSSCSEIDNVKAFRELQSKECYLITKDELLRLCQKAFSDKIAERIFEEATAK